MSSNKKKRGPGSEFRASKEIHEAGRRLNHSASYDLSLQDNAHFQKADTDWMREFAAALTDRVLALWALSLRDAEPANTRCAYIWRELARLELRRRRRSAVL